MSILGNSRRIFEKAESTKKAPRIMPALYNLYGMIKLHHFRVLRMNIVSSVTVMDFTEVYREAFLAILAGPILLAHNSANTSRKKGLF